MSAFPDTDTRYAEVLAARRVPREQWRNYHKWVRFYLHCCLKYRHRPADSKSLQLFVGAYSTPKLPPIPQECCHPTRGLELRRRRAKPLGILRLSQPTREEQMPAQR